MNRKTVSAVGRGGYRPLLNPTPGCGCFLAAAVSDPEQTPNGPRTPLEQIWLTTSLKCWLVEILAPENLCSRSFGVCSGSVRGVRARSVRGPRGVRSGSARDTFSLVQGPFGVRAGSVRDPFGIRSGPVRDPFGIRSWGPFGVRSGSVPGSVPDPFRVRSGSVCGLNVKN